VYKKKVGLTCVILVLLILATSLAGCSNNTTPPPPTQEGNFKSQDKPAFVGSEQEVYYMVTFVSGVDYWVGVYEGFKDAGRQLGVKTVYTGTPEYDINAQVTVFEQVVALKPAGIALCPINAEAFVEPIRRAREQGIPVMVFATDSPDADKIAYITSDNVVEGKMAADFIGRELNGQGEIAVLENLGQYNHELRVSSLIDRLAEKWPGVKVVARSNSRQDSEIAATSLQTMVQANPNIKFVYSVEATSGAGAGVAAKELGKDIKVLTFDASPDVLDMVKDGTIYAAIMPNVVQQGYWSMLTLFVYNHQLVNPMNDSEVSGESIVNIPYFDNGLNIVTKENADYFYTSKYLAKRGSKGFNESGSQMTNPDLPGFWRK
jgi:ribose transport system substrate-binding protein